MSTSEIIKIGKELQKVTDELGIENKFIDQVKEEIDSINSAQRYKTVFFTSWSIYKSAVALPDVVRTLKNGVKYE
jgi:hypothetical protein